MKLKFTKTIVFNKQTITRTAEVEGEAFNEKAIEVVRALVEGKSPSDPTSESGAAIAQ